MSRRCKKRRLMAEMNVVPYIDVMLVLLVIFMVTAPMMQSSVPLDLPSSDAESTGDTGTQGALVISLNLGGIITLEDGSQELTQVNESELISQIKEKIGDQGKRLVNIRADKNITYQYIMKIITAAQKAGAKKIGLIAEPTPSE